jgi:hypothetical protein
MAEQEVYLFRINLSHTSIDALESVIKAIQSWTYMLTCLNSEGAQDATQGNGK